VHQRGEGETDPGNFEAVLDVVEVPGVGTNVTVEPPHLVGGWLVGCGVVGCG